MSTNIHKLYIRSLQKRFFIYLQLSWLMAMFGIYYIAKPYSISEIDTVLLVIALVTVPVLNAVRASKDITFAQNIRLTEKAE